MSQSREHILLDLHSIGIPEIPVFGRYEYTSVHHGLSAHVHEDCLEICYLHRGEQTYCIGEREFALVGGDIFLTRPGEVHSTGNKPQDRGILYWMHLQLLNGDGSILKLPATESRVLTQKLITLPQRHFTGHAAMRGMLEAVFLAAGQPPSTFQKLSIRNYLIRYLLDLIACAEAQGRSHPSKLIAETTKRIRAHPENDFVLEELASSSNLSLSRFKARFKAEIGISPKDFVLRAKINAAKNRLVGKTTCVTDIAFDLGFSSSQHFATVFKRYTGQTPLEFRLAAAPLPRTTAFRRL